MSGGSLKLWIINNTKVRLDLGLARSLSGPFENLRFCVDLSTLCPLMLSWKYQYTCFVLHCSMPTSTLTAACKINAYQVAA